MIAGVARRVRAALDVTRAIVAIRRARQAVASRPLGALVERVPTSSLPTPDLSAAQRGRRPDAIRQKEFRWSLATDRALRWTPGDSACLVRASALRALLAADGLAAAEVRIGVRRGAAGFEAHAWVELDGMPIAEPEGLAGAFASLEGVTLR